MRKQVSLLLCAAVIFIVAGCWDYQELEQRGLVCCVGIDRAAEEKRIKMTASVIRPGEVSSETGQGGIVRAKTACYTATGETVMDTIRNFLMQSSRRLFWGHNRHLIFGEEIAREGVFLIIDSFLRGTESRLRNWIFIAKGVEAKEILETSSKMEDGPGPELDGLIESSLWFSAFPRVDLKFFSERLGSKTAAAVAPSLELIRAGKETDAGDYPGTSGPAGAAAPKLQRLRLTGTAVFKGDRLVGWLNRFESRGLLWVLGEVQSGIIVVRCPGDESNLVSLELVKQVSKVRPEKRNGKILIAVEIKTESHLVDQQGTADLSTPEALQALGRRQATLIKNQVCSAIEKARLYRADIFAFGETIGQKFPQEWRELERCWDEAFRELEIELNVNAQISRIGRIGKPVARMQEHRSRFDYTAGGVGEYQ